MIDLPLSNIATFVGIVECGSLRAAAKSLGVKPPAISYRLNQLEKEIGTPLLIRTTRSLELTEAGRRLFDRSSAALQQVSAAITDASQVSNTPRGTLCIALSHIAFRYTLADHIADFQAEYPELQLDLSFSDELVDLAAGEFHAGIRIGDLLDQGMIAVRLTGTRRIVYIASPDYLDRNGRPSRPEDLLHHQCIRYRFGTTWETTDWEFKGPEGPVKVNVEGSVIVNNTTAQIDAARLGLGIAWFGEKIVEDEIRRGELEIILDDYSIERPPFFLYFPKEYQDLKVLRVFIDFLKQRIKKITR